MFFHIKAGDQIAGIQASLGMRNDIHFISSIMLKFLFYAGKFTETV